MNRIIQRYAAALFELAEEQKKVKAYQSDVQQILEVYKTNSDFVFFMNHVMINREEKKNLFREIFAQSVSQYSLSFVFLMIDKERYRIIPEVLQYFKQLCNEYLDIRSGIVYSVRKLDEKEMHRAELLASKQLNAQVELENQIDDTLIAGIKIVVNDMVIDGTVKNRFEALHSNLLYESGCADEFKTR